MRVLETRVLAHDRQFSALQRQFVPLTDRAQEFANLKQILDRVATEYFPLTQEVAQLRGVVDLLQTQFSRLDSKVLSHESCLREVQENHRQLKSDLTGLHDKVRLLEQKVTPALKSQIDSLTSEFRAANESAKKQLRIEINQLKTNISKLETSQNDSIGQLKQTIETVNSSVQTVSAQTQRDFTTRLKSEVETLTAANSTLSMKVNSQVKSLTEVVEKVTVFLRSTTGGLESRLSGEIATVRREMSQLQKSPISRASPQSKDGLDSLILTEVPPLLSEFANKPWKLLYRGARDGFNAVDFHTKSDGHTPTLTVIQAPGGWIFGGYTPVLWSSPSSKSVKSDPSMKSFLFTLRNPHGTAPMKFPLKLDRKDRAIVCEASWGPTFGSYDIYIADDCNIQGRRGPTNECSDFGTVYLNESGLDGKTLLVGEKMFRVEEIEVFEIGNMESSHTG
jgi:uncharacterized coiled-coil DUF342 family protein